MAHFCDTSTQYSCSLNLTDFKNKTYYITVKVTVIKQKALILNSEVVQDFGLMVRPISEKIFSILVLVLVF